MSKRSLADKLDGFELRGRSHLHPYLYGYPIAWRKIPLILIYKKGRDLVMGTWEFSLAYGLLYLTERAKWLTEYMPPDGLDNKRVLDIGAGCGESAKFFLENGASRVLAVENNIEARIYLKRNALKKKGLIVSNRPTFDPEFHLKDPSTFDLVKCDIEGYEIHLANWLERNPPFNMDMVIEAHSSYMVDRFHQLGFDKTEDPIWGFDPPWGLSSSARLMYRWARR